MSKEPTTNSQGLSEECHAMISRISHEVRNPVAVIHSFHQLLLLAHPELSNDLYFQKIQENMAFLNSLLDELSCYNHSYRAVRAYVNPYLLLQNLCADTGVLLEKQQVSIELVKESAIPRFALRLLGGISRRLHGLVHDVQAYSLHSGMQRVIGYLLSSLPEESARTLPTLEAYAGQGCPPVSAAARPVIALKVSLPVSKATIASLLSITPEYFSRVLRDLETEGLIHIDKRDILIPDAMRLAHYTP